MEEAGIKQKQIAAEKYKKLIERRKRHETNHNGNDDCLYPKGDHKGISESKRSGRAVRRSKKHGL